MHDKKDDKNDSSWWPNDDSCAPYEEPIFDGAVKGELDAIAGAGQGTGKYSDIGYYGGFLPGGAGGFGSIIPLAPNGVLDLQFGGQNYEITGGPYHAKPDDAIGIKLAVEIDEECHIDLPIADFDVPAQHEMEIGVLRTIAMLLDFGGDYELYAGCMGGRGRTGLLFACIVKVEQELNRRWWQRRKDPVERVRETYYMHAVETKDQQEFVEEFDAKSVAKFVKRYI
jgi:hypothetical protein